MASDTVVVPFRVEQTEPSGAMAYFLATEHWLDAITPPLNDHIDQLVGVAQGLLGRAGAVPGAPAATAPPGEPVPARATPAGRRRTLPRPALVAAGAVLAIVLGVVATVVALQSGGGPDDGTS